MRKIIVILAMVSGACLAQVNLTDSTAGLVETVGTTQYVGVAKTTLGMTTVSTNAEIWRITKYIIDTNGAIVSWGSGYSTNAQATGTLRWSERASTNTVYKLAQ
jgi:hypothetical protein